MEMRGNQGVGKGHDINRGIEGDFSKQIPGKKAPKMFDGRSVSVDMEPREQLLIKSDRRGTKSILLRTPLDERKTAKLEKAIDSKLKRPKNKASAIARAFKKCVAVIAGTATSAAMALVGVASGAAIGGLLGGLLLGPVGLLVGGVVGVLLGGTMGLTTGIDAGNALESKIDNPKGAPHKKRWMQEALGSEVIKLL